MLDISEDAPARDSVALTFGEKSADIVKHAVGSWRLIITQTVVLVIWMVWNRIPGVPHWDVYPFMFMNLVLSLQAAYTGPIVMISQNRQEQIQHRQELLQDRMIAEIRRQQEIQAEMLSAVWEVTKSNRLLLEKSLHDDESRHE